MESRVPFILAEKLRKWMYLNERFCCPFFATKVTSIFVFFRIQQLAKKRFLLHIEYNTKTAMERQEKRVTEGHLLAENAPILCVCCHQGYRS